MSGISFDWTISVGNLITVLLVVGGWFYAFFQLKSDVRIVKHDLKALDFKQGIINESLTQLSLILTKVAVQDERFNSQEHRIDVAEQDIRDLQSGIGFKTEKLSGEYTTKGRVSRV